MTCLKSPRIGAAGPKIRGGGRYKVLGSDSDLGQHSTLYTHTDYRAHTNVTIQCRPHARGVDRGSERAKGLSTFQQLDRTRSPVSMAAFKPLKARTPAPIALLRPMPAHHAHAQAVAHACCPGCFQLLGAAVPEWPCCPAANHSAKISSPKWRQTNGFTWSQVPRLEHPNSTI